MKSHASPRTAPSVAPAQRRAAPSAGASNAEAAAALGGTARVPAEMEAAFGADFSDVRIRLDGAAAQAGALAYAQGNEIHFQPSAWAPDTRAGQELLGHELAHVVQQRAGRAGGPQHAGRIDGDPSLEAEADRMGAKAAAGQAVSMPGQAAGARPKAVSGAPIQRYAVQRGQGGDMRVSEDGRMAVMEGYPNHQFWADAAMISSSNAALQSKGSAISLAPGAGTVQVTRPDGKGTARLTQVVPTNRRTKTSGNAMKHYADCGRSTRDVVAGSGERWGMLKAAYTVPQKDPATGKETLKPMSSSVGHRPDAWKAQVYDEVGGEAAYRAMHPSRRRAFDRRHSINDFADPEVGGGFTTSSGGDVYKGYEKNTWNFHFAGVVMKSGGDFVSLENFSVSDPEVSNTDWTFDMYGPAHKAGQTFHDQHAATKQHGKTPTTMAIKGA
jgi:hypothetical protein